MDIYVYAVGISAIMAVLFSLIYRKIKTKWRPAYFIVVAVFFVFLMLGVNKESGYLSKNEIIKQLPMLEALHKINPLLFNELYTAFSLHGRIDNKDNLFESNEVKKAFLSARSWMDDNIGSLLAKSPDYAANEYGKFIIKSLQGYLNEDPSGVLCFNVLYPGVFGYPDVAKLRKSNNDFIYKRTFLNDIADSIGSDVKINKLPVAEIESTINEIVNEMIEKYGDIYFSEDPHELFKQPGLDCKMRIDFTAKVLALDPDLSAEIFRYINKK